MINKKLVSDFANIIGNLEIVIQLDSFNDVKENYKMILNTLLEWVKYYYENNNLHEKSLEIHNLLEEIKWKLLPNKEISDESLLADDIFIRYEVIVKTINDEMTMLN